MPIRPTQPPPHVAPLQWRIAMLASVLFGAVSHFVFDWPLGELLGVAVFIVLFLGTIWPMWLCLAVMVPIAGVLITSVLGGRDGLGNAMVVLGIIWVGGVIVRWRTRGIRSLSKRDKLVDTFE